MNLTDTAIRSAKPKDKNYKMRDGFGMYLFITPKGGKYFRLDYRFSGKRKTLSLGVYPETTLKEAREKRDEARKLISNGIDPLKNKKEIQQQAILDLTSSFKAVSKEWFEKNKNKWTAKHASRKMYYLEREMFPNIGDMHIKDVTPRILLNILELIQKRGAIETAHRIKGICGAVFKYGIVTGRCERDPSQDLKGALIPTKQKNMAAITNTKDISGLLRAIESYNGDIITKLALKLTPYVVLRPGELRCAEWSEIDLVKKQWKIPAGKMKMRREHIVPLSKQVIAIFEELQPLTGRFKYVFPSMRSTDRPMSNNTINAALRRMGYSKDEQTAHGFRGMASTLLHENNFESAHIEAQLAHAERNKVKAAYNHAQYLEQRTKMMQWLANYQDDAMAS